MTQNEVAVERTTLRRLHRLRLVADPSAAYRLRLAAVRSVQATMTADHPLKNRDPERLLAAVRHPWNSARDVVWQPTRLDDLWEFAD